VESLWKSGKSGWAAGLAAMLLGLGCSADLHEIVGPTIPFPNVSGRIVRSGVPVVNVKVELEAADADSSYDDDYTDGEGRFEFPRVPAGSWRIRVESSEPGDFARVQHDFELASVDSMEFAPDLDLGMGEFAVEEPAPDQMLPLPGFFSPLNFKWRGTEARVQIRLYRSDGAPVWFSEKVRDTRLRWNGIGNMPGFEGKPVPEGAYRWRTSLDGLGSMQYVTDYRNLQFVP
jgi:hypothetical protein